MVSLTADLCTRLRAIYQGEVIEELSGCEWSHALTREGLLQEFHRQGTFDLTMQFSDFTIRCHIELHYHEAHGQVQFDRAPAECQAL